MSELVKQLKSERCKAKDWLVLAICSGAIGTLFGSYARVFYGIAEIARNKNLEFGYGAELGMPEQLQACMGHTCAVSSIGFFIGATYCSYKWYAHKKNEKTLELRLLNSQK